MFGKPFDYFLVEEPWRVYEVLEKALGKHNTELIIGIMADWLIKHNCRMTPAELEKVFSDKSMWSK